MNTAFLLAGLGAGYIFCYFYLTRKKGVRTIIEAVRKKQPLAILETQTHEYITPIVKVFRNLAITKDKDIIILPAGTLKPCVDLGIQVAHADMYKAIAVPQELRLFINQLLNSGWTSDEIAEFFSEIMKIPKEELKERYIEQIEDMKANGKSDEEIKNSRPFQKLNLFINLPSTIRDFLYTGVNQVTLHSMIRELVFQRELERIKKRNWIYIAIAVFILVLAIAIGLRFVLTTPGLLPGTAGGGGGVPSPPPRIAP